MKSFGLPWEDAQVWNKQRKKMNRQPVNPSLCSSLKQCVHVYLCKYININISPYHDNSGLSWTISAPVKGIAVPVERHGILQTLICAPMVRPKWCPTSSNPALLPSWTVICPSFTLLMMLLLPGWPTMGLNHISKKKKNILLWTWQLVLWRSSNLNAVELFNIFHWFEICLHLL